MLPRPASNNPNRTGKWRGKKAAAAGLSYLEILVVTMQPV
jgi:hypothetical protein